MKVLILEDDFAMIKAAFDYLNIKFFSNKMVYTVYKKTQDIPKDIDINSYDKIFVDISLQNNSSQDGYSFIKSIISQISDFHRIVIITGSDKVEAKLSEFKLPNIKVLNKPITFKDLKSVII